MMKKTAYFATLLFVLFKGALWLSGGRHPYHSDHVDYLAVRHCLVTRNAAMTSLK